jgi:predicted metal-dependent RNase
MTIAQEFSLALVEDRAEQFGFEPLIAKFEELKENTISKLNNLINESDEELNKRLTETKDRIQKTIISKDEYVKLWKLNQNI